MRIKMGNPGVGKSGAIESMARKNNLKIKKIRMKTSQSDMTGIPSLPAHSSNMLFIDELMMQCPRRVAAAMKLLTGVEAKPRRKKKSRGKSKV